MNHLALFAACAGALLACATQGVAEVITPRIISTWAEQAPVLDGRLDDSVWQCAPQAPAFLTPRGNAKALTSARIAWDGTALYVAFDCKAPRESLKTIYMHDGEPVWQDESIELFIAPYDAPAPSAVHQFVVNPAGAKTMLVADSVAHNRDWDARVAQTPDGWSAEIRIPLSTFQSRGANEAAWRILFARNSKAGGESSSYPLYDGRFSHFWAYARLLPSQGHPSFLTLRSLLVPRPGAGEATGVIPIKQAAIDEGATPLIIPQPLSARFTRGKFPLDSKTRIVIGEHATQTDAQAAQVLAEWISERAGLTPPIVRETDPAGRAGEGRILVGEPWLNAQAAAALEKSKDTVTRETPGKEGYVVRVTPDVAIASGCDQTGTFWAAQTLAQLIQTDGQNNYWLAGGVVTDKPAMEFRSVHLLTSRDTLEFQTRLIKTILSPFKINYVILQLDKYQWESHPEISDPDNHCTAEDIRKLVALAKQYHITYIPLVPSLGHMEFIFRDPKNKAFAEDPNHPYAYCPLDERSYKLTYDLFNEAYDLFGRPGYFHIGHDEYDMLGKFPTHPECKKLGKVELYYRDTKRLVEYLRQKGARTMIWADIVAKPGYRERIDELPKDIVMVDWHYGPEKTQPTVDFLQQHGFPVLGGTWYVPENIFYFSKYAQQKGMLGMMQTTWSGWEPADVVIRDMPEQMYQYILGAAWAWAPGRPDIGAMPYLADEVFNDRYFAGLEQPLAAGAKARLIRPAQGELFTVDLGAYANASLRDNATQSAPGWIGSGRGQDLSGLRAGLRRLGALTYRILTSSGTSGAAVMLRGPEVTQRFPREVTGIKVGSTAKQLWFLQTTAYQDGADLPVGSYVIHYADGASEQIPLEYARNIMAWTDDRPTLAHQAAWAGKAKDGTLLRLRACPWVNPYPEKEIATIDFKSAQRSQASPVLIAITGIR